MAYRLLFCSDTVDGSDAVDESGTVADLPSCPGVLEFRRDVIASDPDWTRMTLLPRPDDPLSDRYLTLDFAEPPPGEQVRDLRYVAARNRLTMVVLA